MVIFNALLNLRELKELYSGKPVCVCPLYKGVINAKKTFEATGNPIVLPEYKSLVKLKITFSPKQAGTGDPSPENVRAISGYDSVTVTQSKGEAQVKQITLTLPETIYGGTVDAVSGAGSKTWGYIASYNGESLPGEWISDRDVYSAGTTPTTGAQVAYKLATPEPFEISKISIPSLIGENTFFTNGNNMDIIYKKSSFWSDEA